MSFLYPIVSNFTASLNSGSYLNKTDYNLFYSDIKPDMWYGTSEKDAIELAVYDLNDNLIFWKSITDIGEYTNSTLTYYDEKNCAIQYLYKQFILDYPIYKTEKLLVNPIENLSSSNLPSGNYILSYQFTRYLAGKPTSPLVVKEISPSKTELKLIPSGEFTLDYNAFCTGKVVLRELSPLYLNLINNCSYDSLYKNSIDKNQSKIDLIKSLFFIDSDGKFIEFLKTIYEDFIKYSSQVSDRVDSFIRIQGIRTYFSNFLVSNTDSIYTFDEIEKVFEKFVTDRLEILFANFRTAQYLPAKQYLFDLFVTDYFLPLHNLLVDGYLHKYGDPLKDALCFGIGQYIPILKTAYIDERTSNSDPLTLLIKLQYPISDDISIKSSVWVANIGMIPFLFNCIIKENELIKTIKISTPDFTIVPKNASFSNTNKYFNNTDLVGDSSNEGLVSISKKINELNVDYTDLKNFVVFSSSELRHNIFKNKMISLTVISSSLFNLDTTYSSSGYVYPYYTSEHKTFENQKSDIIESFDGFESYLYKTGYYEYNLTNKTFNSSSFVNYMDEETKRYDKFNRDSLVNNTPEHITTDSENDDYLIFLSMMGHYFDNVYIYIKSLPSERSSENNTTFSKNILQQMLQSFGWKLDASLESLNISDNYLDSDLNGTVSISADNRTREVWNRILNTLPLIYKTKGTEECIRLVLSCYGIPSTLINIREYGGIDYSDTGKTSYSIEEKIFMLVFKGYREYISIPFTPILQTIEFKTSIDPLIQYTPYKKIPLAVKYNQYNEIDWTVGVYKEPKQYLGRSYFELGYPTYKIGFIGDYGIIDSTHSQSLQVSKQLTIENPDIILTLGNNTFETGSNAYDNTVGRVYHQFINPYIGVSGSGATINRFFPTIGSNDYINGSYGLYQSFFPTTSRFYTFKQGNIQFFMLNSDTNEPSGSSSVSSQATWLTQQISGSFNDVDVLWRIAVFNKDFLSSGNSTGSYMNWPYSSWGIDLVVNGNEHFYERLEQGIPIIVAGIGGQSTSSFTSVVSQSKFRWNNMQGYSILTTRGNYLKFSVYDMFGNHVMDTGSVTLPSCSIDNGSFVIQKTTVPFSDRPFRQSDKYIVSDSIPIFNGEIFNIMIRKNDPDNLFEYNPIVNLIPTKYDLWTQRKNDGRTIFNSLKSDFLTQTYNYKFSNSGEIYFGNYQNSSSFHGILDKILLWESAITDHTFNDHCNNINSYSYTGSAIPHQTLYFRMNFDYPKDLSLINPTRIINSNEYYSSSIFANACNFGIVNYSASIDNCISTSHSYYPYQFRELPYNQTFTITSYGPNKFKNQKVQKIELPLAARLDPDDRSSYSTNKFVSPDSNQIGLFADPNDYKNKDIFRYFGDYGVTNLIADPSQMFDDKYYPLKSIRDLYNSSGNKKVLYNEMFTLYKFYFDKSIFDTIKQLIPARNTVFTGILIEPTVLERPKYQYKKLCSEVCILEFTSSTIPASITSSNNIRPPTLSMNNSIHSSGTIKGDIIAADFKFFKDVASSQVYEQKPFFIPIGPQDPNSELYKRYVQLQSGLTFVYKGWIKKYPNVGELKRIEQHSNWPIPAGNKVYDSDFTPAPIGGTLFSDLGSGYLDTIDGYFESGSGYYYLRNCYFYVTENQNANLLFKNLDKNITSFVDVTKPKLLTINYPTVYNNGKIDDIVNVEELGIHCDETGKIIESVISGSNYRYLIKSWNKDTTYVSKGDYSKPQTVSSQSLYFYTTQIWSAASYLDLVYTSSTNVLIPLDSIVDVNIPDYSPVYTVSVDGWSFHHDVGTFKHRPNTTKNNIFGKFYKNNPSTLDIFTGSFNQFYETFKGYPRNHLTHKRLFFSKESKPQVTTVVLEVSQSIYNNVIQYFNSYRTVFDRYIKSRQSIDTTVDINGLGDNSLPVQIINVSNINVIKTENVLG